MKLMQLAVTQWSLCFDVHVYALQSCNVCFVLSPCLLDTAPFNSFSRMSVFLHAQVCVWLFETDRGGSLTTPAKFAVKWQSKHGCYPVLIDLFVFVD